MRPKAVGYILKFQEDEGQETELSLFAECTYSGMVCCLREQQEQEQEQQQRQPVDLAAGQLFPKQENEI